VGFRFVSFSVWKGWVTGVRRCFEWVDCVFYEAVLPVFVVRARGAPGRGLHPPPILLHVTTSPPPMGVASGDICHGGWRLSGWVPGLGCIGGWRLGR